jgi:hypothetical protein
MKYEALASGRVIEKKGGTALIRRKYLTSLPLNFRSTVEVASNIELNFGHNNGHY